MFQRSKKGRNFQSKIDSLNEQIVRLNKDNQNLVNQSSQLKHVAEILPWGLIIIDKDGQIDLINKAATKILELTKIKKEESLDQMNTQQIKKIVQKALQGKKIKQKVEFAHNQRIVEAKALPLINQNDQIEGALITLQDTTKIEALANVKKDFVANVSHDLRTPIASIKSLTEALMAGAKDDPKTLNRFLKELDNQSERLSALARDILDLAKIENKETLALNTFALEPLLRQSINIFKHQAENKRLTIDLKINDNPQINADAEQLTKVFSNLLDNCIKYTPEKGLITIMAAKNNGHVNISFKDSGIGIAQKELPRIFERFYRVSKSRSIKTGGTGLGLSIVKHVVENHNGKIKVESQLNKGSEFIITLPG